MADIIKPEDVTGINKMKPDEIAKLSEQVITADAVLHDVNDELENLSSCLSNLHQTKKKYDEIANGAKRKMRNIIPML